MNVVLVLYPLEALVFNYLSFGFLTFVNSVWTWVVVITAAFSFWRIKTFQTLPTLEPRRGNIFGHVLISPSPLAQSVVTTSSSSQVERVSSQLASNEEGTKGKLTVYFKQYEESEHNGDGECHDQEGEDNDVESCEEWFENWDRLLRMKKGEMGWYSYQDTKVIDGNVVRLWDDSRRR
ncbi:hypothetical protein P3S68_004016 [Capsicum galapagoense]